MAGMSPLKVVEFVRGMENSRRKTFWAPEKPSGRSQISSRERRDREGATHGMLRLQDACTHSFRHHSFGRS